MARIISFVNYKGGVGKTTTTYHIGCALAYYHNKKVLLVDIDPQTNLTFLCAEHRRWEEQKRRVGTIATLYDRFKKGIALDTSRYIWHHPISLPEGGYLSNLDLLPCDIDLLGEDLGGGQIPLSDYSSFEESREQAKKFFRERMFLYRALTEVSHKYDYILIDCPPNIYLMTQNALVVSSHYIITTIPDHLSTIGLSILQKKVKKIEKLLELSHALCGENKYPSTFAQLGGVIFVKIRIGGDLITDTHQRMMNNVRSLIGNDACFQYYTTELIGYSEAAESCHPIWLHQSPNAKRAARKREYENITQEFLRRF